MVIHMFWAKVLSAAQNMNDHALRAHAWCLFLVHSAAGRVIEIFTVQHKRCSTKKRLSASHGLGLGAGQLLFFAQ